MRKLCRQIVCISLVCAILSGNINIAFASESMTNFQKQFSYTHGEFTDVTNSDWFYDDVISAYEYGLTKGAGEFKFMPYELVSVAQIIAFGARIHSIYSDNSESFDVLDGQKWYEPYIRYAIDNTIIKESDGFNATANKPATRQQTAYVLANSLPFTEFSNINTHINSLVDVSVESQYYNEIIMLYRAGVLSGRDEYGTFSPTQNITRAEIAAIINRIVNPSARLSTSFITEKKEVSSSEKYDAQKVSEQASPCVFYIELYDKSGKATSSGSGFFIASDGTAVTNYHVIENAYSAKIVTSSGNIHEVESVLGVDEKNDLAIINVEGEGYPYLELADSDEVKSGQQIFCIGSPLGLDNTISEGIVSNPFRTLDGCTYIQISAPISAGSSGGAVLDTSSRVIGVSSAGFEEGQNLNLAMPSNLILKVERNLDSTLSEFQNSKNGIASGGTATSSSSVFYSDNTNIPNYGYFSGSYETESYYDEESSMMLRAYRLNTTWVTYYMRILQSCGFALAHRQQSGGGRKLDVIYSKGNDVVGIMVDAASNSVIIAYYI
ncbi:MAG: trypsin-like serine protease [Ruminococcaceae bacterium]|nr:trypsin-like serine protease [Oscillospiraceae bacterium]